MFELKPEQYREQRETNCAAERNFPWFDEIALFGVGWLVKHGDFVICKFGNAAHLPC